MSAGAALPRGDAETAEFMRGARDGVLLVPVCDACHRSHWYPRTLCPFCSGATAFRPASGRGALYSFAVTPQPGGSPHVLAFVQLEEGPVMMTNIIDADPSALAIGDAVQVRFAEDADGVMQPMFTPAGAAS